MIQILVLVLVLAAIGCVVAFVAKLDMPAIFRNLIYLVVVLGVIAFLIHALQSGALPSVRL